MFNKILLLTPVILISAGMTACSGHKPQKITSTVNKTNVNKAISTSESKKIIPIVFEKRSPANKRKATQKYHPRIAHSSFANKLSSAALGRLNARVRYDGKYLKIAYPWGDVPANIGVCTDVVIRSYRKLGIDLQQQVHLDMSSAFNTYPNPKKWGLSRPDSNIDHRRVYNLRKFFSRKGAALPITRNPHHYRPGDIVSWMVGPDLPHIGVVVNKRSKTDPRRLMVVHNISRGPQLEDMLFKFPITGHYRYTPAHVRNNTPQTLLTSNKRSPRSVTQSDINLLEAAATSLLVTAPKVVTTEKASPLRNDKKIVLATLSDDAVRELLAQ